VGDAEKGVKGFGSLAAGKGVVEQTTTHTTTPAATTPSVL